MQSIVLTLEDYGVLLLSEYLVESASHDYVMGFYLWHRYGDLSTEAVEALLFFGASSLAEYAGREYRATIDSIHRNIRMGRCETKWESGKSGKKKTGIAPPPDRSENQRAPALADVWYYIQHIEGDLKQKLSDYEQSLTDALRRRYGIPPKGEDNLCNSF